MNKNWNLQKNSLQEGCWSLLSVWKSVWICLGRAGSAGRGSHRRQPQPCPIVRPSWMGTHLKAPSSRQPPEHPLRPPGTPSHFFGHPLVPIQPSPSLFHWCHAWHRLQTRKPSGIRNFNWQRKRISANSQDHAISLTTYVSRDFWKIFRI